MPSLKIAGVDVENVQVGSTEVQAVYVGSTKIWEKGYSAVMTTAYNTHTYSYTNIKHYETGYALYSTLPTSPPDSMGSPAGSLSITNVEIGNGNEEIFYLRCVWAESNSSNKTLGLTLTGTNSSGSSNYTNNGGWETLKIGGFTFSRSSASFNGVQGSHGYSRRWTWTTSTNPFGSTRGATKNIQIT